MQTTTVISSRPAAIFVSLTLLLSVANVYSQDTAIEEIVIIGDTVGELGLNSETLTGSRLGLSVMETPAAVDIISSEVMRARGYQKVIDAVQSLPGVIAGDHPSSPSTFSMRGFSRGQVSVLRDGLWVGPSSMVMRPQNTFNLERIEVLRGPSSVLNGQGAVGSTVNTISKSAVPGAATSVDALVSFARFDSYQVGIGAGGSFNDELGYRLDVSTYGAEGYVENTNPESSNIIGSLAWQAANNLLLKFSVDYLTDDVGSYFGTPLVPFSAARRPMTDIIESATGETIDESMRFKNYNVSDARSESEQLFLRGDLSWEIADGVTLNNSLYTFNADREWVNAEGYVYCTQVVDVCTSVGDIQRYYGYFMLFHDQEQFGDRLTLSFDNEVAGMRNRFLTGTEFMNVDFTRTRGFRRSIAPVAGDSVDPYNPVPGVYGTQELRGVSPTKVNSLAFFAEDALQLTDQLSLVSALRYDELDLDRKNFNAEGVDEASGFKRKYDWWSYRIGMVFNLNDDLALYGQYSNAKDPIGSNIYLVNSNQNFDLTEATQWELGMKALTAGGRGEFTLAYFNIKRDDIQEVFARDSSTNIGGIDSHGFEASATFAMTEQWKVGANTGHTKAVFARSANMQVLAGNTPPNVPELTANAWTSYSNIAGLPLELGAGFRYVDNRYADNNNQILLKSYHLLDAYAAWVNDNYRVTLRVDNLSDEPYITWSDVYYLGQTNPSFIYANQVMLGSPRTFSLTIQAQY